MVDILTPIKFIYDFMKSFFDKLSSVRLSVGVFEVPLTFLLLSFIILTMAISVWWKGAKG